MYKYEIKCDKHFTATVCGETLALAIEHANYWYKEEDKIKTVDQIISTDPIDYYPYSFEDAVRLGIKKKINTIHAILQSDAADFDKLDLIQVIVDENPVQFMALDTACRDKFVEIINENLCDDIIQLILQFTDPYMELTEEDAGRIMGEMEAQGYTLPIGFTPKDFLETYKECEPEDEEEDEQDD